jgi:signal transduction histidine kinase
MGYLLMLRDVTEQMHTQARLMEQQQIMATLRERERLARELHDGLAQSIAAAHLQASTAKLLLTQGATADLGECLDGILDTTMQAETDVRDYLLAAKTVISAGRTFFPALREHLQRFSRQYGLPVELSVPPELEEHGLAPAIEVQLLRIIQEALSNVRKHACADHVRVCFSIAEQRLRVAIIDDGLGFDPVTLVSAGGGYGLRAMRERAETLSGSLTVSSRAGQGTEVVALLPLEP